MNPLRLVPAFFVLAAPLFAGAISPAAQAQLDVRLAEIKTWAASPALVAAVAAQNSTPSSEVVAMTEETWASLSVDAPFVRAHRVSPVGLWLKSKQAPWVSEAFLSDAAGRKVAFLTKPTHWSHAGAAKHDQPLLGKTWQGAPELDQSTGREQVQISVPVLSSDQKPIGSLVVGIPVEKLE